MRGRSLNKLILRHTVQIVPCPSRHRDPADNDGRMMVAQCSVCGELDFCNKRVEMLTDTQTHQRELLDACIAAVRAVQGRARKQN